MLTHKGNTKTVINLNNNTTLAHLCQSDYNVHKLRVAVSWYCGM